MPVIELRPVEDPSALDAALARLPQYDWLVFTSTNAVEYFMARLRASALDVRSIRGRLCAIGTATRDALEACSLKVDLLPDDAVAEGVVQAFASIRFGRRQRFCCRGRSKLAR